MLFLAYTNVKKVLSRRVSITREKTPTMDVCSVDSEGVMML